MPRSTAHDESRSRLVETSNRIRDLQGLPRLAPEQILGEAAAPAPDLAPEDVKAVCRGACRAVAQSQLADVPPPAGDGLARLASAIDRMHEAEADRG